MRLHQVMGFFAVIALLTIIGSLVFLFVADLDSLPKYASPLVVLAMLLSAAYLKVFDIVIDEEREPEPPKELTEEEKAEKAEKYIKNKQFNRRAEMQRIIDRMIDVTHPSEAHKIRTVFRKFYTLGKTKNRFFKDGIKLNARELASEEEIDKFTNEFYQNVEKHSVLGNDLKANHQKRALAWRKAFDDTVLNHLEGFDWQYKKEHLQLNNKLTDETLSAIFGVGKSGAARKKILDELAHKVENVWLGGYDYPIHPVGSRYPETSNLEFAKR